MSQPITTCPFCSCGCGLYLQLRDGELVGSAPSENHPVSGGRLCARGWHAHQAPAWGHRLTRPMIRHANRLVPVSWQEALETAARGISAVLASGKSVGVLGSARATNEENYLAAKLAHDVLHTRHLDSSLSSTYRPLRAGIADVNGGRAPLATFEDLEKSDVIILLEEDLARTHPRAAFSVMRAVRRGARLVTLGWVRTQMSRLAALHIPVSPNALGDVLSDLTAAAANETVAATPPQRLPEGYERLRDSVSGMRPSEPARSAAEWYARAERAAILISPTGLSPDQARRSARALTTLAAVTGHLGRPGSIVTALPVRWNLRGACEMGVSPESPPSRAPLASKEESAECEGAVADRDPVDQGGVDAERMMSEVSALIIVADDPPSALPMGSASRLAMAGMECVVLLDAFSTSTTEIAHVVLPIASFAETDGTSTNLEGRLQRVRPCLPPPGEARPGWQVLVELASRLGARFSYESVDQVMQEIAQAIPAYAGLSRRALEEPWGVMTAAVEGQEVKLPELQSSRKSEGEGSYVLTWEGVLDWGEDPLVAFSPVLSREHVSQRKLFPDGTVEISKQDADNIGVRSGWPLRLTSETGEVVLPASIRSDLEPGVLMVPYALREQAAAVLGKRGVACVRVERA